MSPQQTDRMPLAYMHRVMRSADRANDLGTRGSWFHAKQHMQRLVREQVHATLACDLLSVHILHPNESAVPTEPRERWLREFRRIGADPSQSCSPQRPRRGTR